MTTGFGLTQIGQIAVGVQDLDSAVAFYRDVLGMQFLFQVPSMAFFDCGGVRLMLAEPDGGVEQRASSIIYYRVDDVNHAFETLSKRRVDLVSDPHLVARMGDQELWMAFFEDIDGNVLGLMSEIPVKREMDNG
jgi:methylmalonyl-CoA/ethylmalonyl-CoA epimerase